MHDAIIIVRVESIRDFNSIDIKRFTLYMRSVMKKIALSQSFEYRHSYITSSRSSDIAWFGPVLITRIEPYLSIFPPEPLGIGLKVPKSYLFLVTSIFYGLREAI